MEVGPKRPSVTELLTDRYQLTMAYSYFKQGKHNAPAVFDGFFRKCPFQGEFAIAGGLESVIQMVAHFKFDNDEIEYLKKDLEGSDPQFFEYLKTLNGSMVNIYAIREGDLVFPSEPLVRIEGPLAFLQILETTILNLLNFPTLITTNARRMKIVAGPEKNLIEFGLRRAQGPDGAMMASQYSYLGGFHGTSNLAAGKAYGMKVFGTMAHAYICSYESLKEIKEAKVNGKDIQAEAIKARKELELEATHEGEFAAFIAYSSDHPTNFVALVDTYDTLNSGVPNFVCVAVAMKRLGLEPRGIRLDSGDLASLSIKSRKFIDEQGKKAGVDLTKTIIFASNDINEDALLALNEKGHAVNSYGIGTNLVTCQKQPALGMVYKLVELNGTPKIKFSEEIGKVPVPARKNIYRVYTKKNAFPMCDVLTLSDEKIVEGQPFKVQDLTDRTARFVITPDKVESVLNLVWNGKLVDKLPTLKEAREYSEKQIADFNPDVLHPTKPKKYRIYLSERLYGLMHDLVEENTIWKELK